ncbi:FmdB family zinc ribbon protein [Humisphaera borealis]|uniref:Zinc ribbon domain-containing protein n=1 Tax=Humisphaera borealis TaxID=2807512 RepID=A0A7M2WPN7_9BACT|nr:zinc ribbon domain-containing protein [Humisphaera borealis]QOV87426.1 zinc ribbon domain-containing protein [Humisphaera borealis]
MPTYEYHCDACQHDFESFHSMSAPPVKKCPKCGKNKVRRLIGAGAGLIFKGSGFYITDYRDAGYSEKAKADAAPEAKSSSGDGKSSDAKSSDGKTETKAESKPAETKSADTAAAPKAESKPAPKSEPRASSSASKKKSK